MPTKIKPKPTGIEPQRLYTLPGFYEASGLGRDSARLAKGRGVELRTLKVGRRKYVEGSNGIDFFRQLANSRTASTEPSSD